MKTRIHAHLVLGCVALLSSTPTFAQSSLVRVTNSYSSKDGSEVRAPGYGMRPSLSSDGTAVLYTLYSTKDGVDIQSVQMDRLALGNTPSVIKGSHIEFPTGAAVGTGVYSFAPSMSGTGAIVAFAASYQAKTDGEIRDRLKIFSVGPKGPQLIFQKSGEEMDSINSIRVSKTGTFVVYETVSYLEDSGVKTSIYVYDIQGKTDKEVWSDESEEAEVGVRGISDDGKRVLLGSVYESETGGGNLSLLNVVNGKITPLTQISDPEAGPCSASWDGAGLMTAFASSAPLVKGDTNRALDVYLASTANPNSYLRVSNAATQGNFSSGQPEISRNGRVVAFISRADNLRPNDLNYAKDLYVFNLGKGRGGLVSYVAGNDDINYPSVSNDGAVVAFVSKASDFDLTDDNNLEDIFVGKALPIPIK